MTVSISAPMGSLLFPVEVLEPSSQAVETRRHQPSSSPMPDADELSDVLAGLRTQSASGVWGYRLLEDVRTLKRKGLLAASSSAAQLAACLQKLGYAASVQRQQASSNTSSGTVQLAHEFVAVAVPGQAQPLIVEPNFRELFQIAYATPRYQSLVQAAPEEVAATYSHLSRLVRLLCREMKYSFEAAGTATPPWRSYSSVLSRWSAVKVQQ